MKTGLLSSTTEKYKNSSFNGINDFTAISGSENIDDFINDKFSFTLTFITNESSKNQYLFGKSSSYTVGGNNNGFIFFLDAANNNYPTLKLFDIYSKEVTYVLPFKVDTNTLYTICLSYNISTATIEATLNNAYNTSKVDFMSISTSNSVMTIGNFSGTSSSIIKPFSGTLFYFSLWDKILNQEDMFYINSSQNKNSGEISTDSDVFDNSNNCLIYSNMLITSKNNPLNIGKKYTLITISNNIIPEFERKYMLVGGRIRYTQINK